MPGKHRNPSCGHVTLVNGTNQVQVTNTKHFQSVKCRKYHTATEFIESTVAEWAGTAAKGFAVSAHTDQIWTV